MYALGKQFNISADRPFQLCNFPKHWSSLDLPIKFSLSDQKKFKNFCYLFVSNFYFYKKPAFHFL